MKIYFTFTFSEYVRYILFFFLCFTFSQKIRVLPVVGKDPESLRSERIKVQIIILLIQLVLIRTVMCVCV